MFFDIALIIFGWLGWALFWHEISSHNKMLDGLNARILNLERNREEEKDRLEFLEAERCQLQTEHTQKHLTKYNK